jgi:hypothetical protein
VIKLRAIKFKRYAAVPNTSRRYRGHRRERHSSKTRAARIAADATSKLFLNTSDTVNAITIGFGTAVPDASQICLNFGITNTQEPTQTQSAGKIKAAAFK